MTFPPLRWWQVFARLRRWWFRRLTGWRFRKFKFPHVENVSGRVPPTLSVDEMLSAQPMTRRTSSVIHWDFKTGAHE